MSPAFRQVPADFLAMAATMRPHALCQHYNAGPAVIRRWQEETNAPAGPDRRLRQPEPPAADFAALAPTLTIDECKARWRRGETTLRRWEDVTGGRMVRSARHRPVPKDFVAQHAVMSIVDLAKHYNACKVAVRRWAVEAGVARKHGTHLTPRKSLPFVRVAPEAPQKTAKLNAKFAPVDRARRDASRAGQAADFLRRFGPVVRCDERGRYAENGTHWRRGSTVLTAEEVVDRAVRNGWQPDAWKLVA